MKLARSETKRGGLRPSSLAVAGELLRAGEKVGHDGQNLVRPRFDDGRLLGGGNARRQRERHRGRDR